MMTMTRRRRTRSRDAGKRTRTRFVRRRGMKQLPHLVHLAFIPYYDVSLKKNSEEAFSSVRACTCDIGSLSVVGCAGCIDLVAVLDLLMIAFFRLFTAQKHGVQSSCV